MDRLLIIGIIGLALLFGCLDSAGAGITSTGSGAPADSIAIPLSQISTNVAHYSYDSDGVQIRYFVVKGSDGVVRSAFDACEVCYRSKKGYTQEGDSVRCNNCGLKFRIDDLGTKNQGRGCWPAYLPNEVKGDQVIIKKSDLESGKVYFDV